MEENMIFDFSDDDFNIDHDENNYYDENEDIEIDENQDNSIENESSEEVDREDNDEEDEDSNDNDDSSSNIFSSLASFAQEQGILPSSLDLSKTEVKSAEDFTKLLEEQNSERIRSAVEEKLATIDLQKMALLKNNINEVESISEEDFKTDIDLAKKIIEQDLQNQNLPERLVKNYMRKLSISDEDAIIEEALNAKESIINYNKIKAEEEYTRQEKIKQEQLELAETQLKELQSSIYDKKEILPGFIPNKTVRDKIFQHITTPVGEDQFGNPITRLVKDSLEDPLGFQIRLHTMYELTDGFKNIDKIGQRQKSNAIKELEKAFKDKPNYGSGPTRIVDPNSYDSPLKYDELNT